MKESIRMMKSSDKLNENNNNMKKVMKMRKTKKIFYSACRKCLTYAKNCIYNIKDKEKMLCLRKKDIGEKLGVENIYDLIDKEIKGRFETGNPTNEQIREYKRRRTKLSVGEKFMYTREDIIMPIIMHCRECQHQQ